MRARPPSRKSLRNEIAGQGTGPNRINQDQHGDKAMNRNRDKQTAYLAAFLLAMVAPALPAADEVPQTTPEGMELRTQTKSRIVYAMPGATLAAYTKVALLDCYVAFAKDWERDYNRSASLQLRVRPDDMERIKEDVAAEFRKVFTQELNDAGYEVVDHTGAEVLIIRPAIINLDVTAPDLDTAGFVETVVNSAGSMTLYMELFDSTTGAIFGRVIDAQGDRETFAQRSSRVTNKAAADRILRGWANELAGHLGTVDADASAGDE